MYRESPHRKRIRNLAITVPLKLTLPHVLDIFVRNKIKTIPFSIDQKPNRQYGRLVSHLDSGGFSRLSKEIHHWEQVAQKYLDTCDELEKLVKHRIPNDEPLFLPNGAPSNNPTLDDFCGTICAIVVERSVGFPIPLKYTIVRHYLFHNMWVLKYGPWEIYLSSSLEELRQYHRVHQDLIKDCSADPIVTDIAVLFREIMGIRAFIRKQTGEFIRIHPLPGHCELC